MAIRRSIGLYHWGAYPSRLRRVTHPASLLRNSIFVCLSFPLRGPLPSRRREGRVDRAVYYLSAFVSVDGALADGQARSFFGCLAGSRRCGGSGQALPASGRKQVCIRGWLVAFKMPASSTVRRTGRRPEKKRRPIVGREENDGR